MRLLRFCLSERPRIMSEHVLPADFTARLAAIVPPERLAVVLASFGQPKPTVLRANTLKTAPEALVAGLAAHGLGVTPVPGLGNAWALQDEVQRRALTETEAFAQGLFYIQSPSSQLAAPLLAPQPGDTVLDLAAAPGGKTTHLAALMANEGKLSAVEAVKDRFFRLRANLEQQGVTIARTFLMDGREVGRKCPDMFDRILLDAPCSSEARFDAADPDSWSHWSLKKVKECARKQQGLITAALHALKPGGVLLYCTCSFSPEENEAAVQHALKRFGDRLEILVAPVPAGIPQQPGLTAWQGTDFHPDMHRAVRILPDACWDGFFLCLLRKRA